MVNKQLIKDDLFQRLNSRKNYQEDRSKENGGIPTSKQGGVSYPDISSFQYSCFVMALSYRNRELSIEEGIMGRSERIFLDSTTDLELDGIMLEHSNFVPFESSGMKSSYFALF